jgi:hypothetical protein
MELFAQTQQKSRLGQILLDKRLVSQEQLSKAMEQQATTGERLGDILTQWNVVTQRHIESALRAQRNLRLVASLVTAMATPFITACGGGGGETSPTTQSSAGQPSAASAQSTQSAVNAASQNPSEGSALSATPSTPAGWVIKESICCAPVAPATTTTAFAPSLPTNLGAVAPSATQINLTWTDNSGGTSKYRIYRDGSATAMAEITGTTYTDYTASGNTSYSYQIRAVDAANGNNTSELSTFPFVTTQAGQNTIALAINSQSGNISASSQGLGARDGSCDLSHTTFC